MNDIIMGASASAMPKPIEAIFHGEPLLAAGGADAFDTYFSKDAKVEFLGQWAPKTADGKAVIITSKELKEVFDCLIKGFSDFTVRRRRGRERASERVRCDNPIDIVDNPSNRPPRQHFLVLEIFFTFFTFISILFVHTHV